MTILNYFLYLAITLLLLCPFIVATTTAIMTAYFKIRMEYAAKLAEGYGNAMLSTAKKLKEKENERTV